MTIQEEIPYTEEEVKAMSKTIQQLRKEKKELLNKAIKWIEENFYMPIDFEQRFRKVMEE